MKRAAAALAAFAALVLNLVVITPASAGDHDNDSRLYVSPLHTEEHIDEYCGPLEVQQAEWQTNDDWFFSWMPDFIEDILKNAVGLGGGQLVGTSRVTLVHQDCKQYFHGSMQGFSAYGHGAITTGTFTGEKSERNHRGHR